jgi:hypothetical protein
MSLSLSVHGPAYVFWELVTSSTSTVLHEKPRCEAAESFVMTRLATSVFSSNSACVGESQT